MNSDCTFCEKPKFIPTPSETGLGFDLKRCETADCDKHCQWGHSNEVRLDLNSNYDDVMDIVRG